jgi:hypothetical protein
MRNFLPALISVTFCGTFAAAQTICTATTASVNGTYGYTATELSLMNGLAITPPGTNPQVYSDTPIGSLIGSIHGGNAFWLAGTLTFDGVGNISAASSSSTLGAQTIVGTYTVSSGCVIAINLTDAFNTTPTSATVTAPTPGTTSLIGLVLGGGSQIDLSAAQSTTSTNGNTPLVNTGVASRLIIQLTRGLSSVCSAATLSGSYGLIGTGFAVVNPSTGTNGTGATGTGSTNTSTGTEQPATLLSILDFDGNGNVIAQTVNGSSPLANFQMTGTYIVNLDCSGSMKLTNMAAPTGTSTGTGTGTGTTTSTPPVLVNFVLTAPSEFPINGQVVASSYSARPGIVFTLWNSSETFFGVGVAQ